MTLNEVITQCIYPELSTKTPERVLLNAAKKCIQWQYLKTLDVFLNPCVKQRGDDVFIIGYCLMQDNQQWDVVLYKQRFVLARVGTTTIDIVKAERPLRAATIMDFLEVQT